MFCQAGKSRVLSHKSKVKNKGLYGMKFLCRNSLQFFFFMLEWVYKSAINYGLKIGS